MLCFTDFAEENESAQPLRPSQLVLSEDKQTVISERLSIRVKTLQDYVTRLYRKTGAKTRSGLTELFHKARIHSADEA